MRKLFLLGLFLSLRVEAQDLSTLIQEAVAKNNDSMAQEVNNVNTVRTPKFIKISFYLEVGEGGGENCTNEYSPQGKLQKSDCEFNYVSHSMGPENKETQIKLERRFNEKGELTKVKGHIKSKNFETKKMIEDRKVDSPKDESIKSLSRPLLSLSDAILKAFPPLAPLPKKGHH